jgi:hypothetical protein
MTGCSVEGCTRKHEARGLCKVHYNKAVRNGEIEIYEKLGRPKLYTEEEAKLRARLSAREKYYKKVGYEKGKRPKKERKQDNPAYMMFRNAIQRSKDKNLPFNLELKDIEIPEVCPLLGIPIIKGIGNYSDNSPTLDKIVPELGYVKGNVWVVSMRANRIKDNATLNELENIVNGLRKILNTNLINK